MAEEQNYQVYRAPSIPKLGKTTSSPLRQNSIASKFRTSKFSFRLANQKVGQENKANQNIKSTVDKQISVNNSIATSLVETNRILVEIQKQLAMDFATRIAEEKNLIRQSRRQEQKRVISKKENALERSKGISGKIGRLANSVLAPAKGLFQRIIDFFLTIAGGIIANKALDWLKDEENRKKVSDVVQFAVDNWKLIVGLIVGVKLLGPILKLLNAAKKLFNFVKRFTNRRPPQPPSSGGRNTGGTPPLPGCPPVSCIDGPVRNIVAEEVRSRSFIDSVLRPVLIGAGFLPSAKPTAVPTPTTPNKTLPPMSEDPEIQFYDKQPGFFERIAQGFTNPKPLTEVIPGLQSLNNALGLPESGVGSLGSSLEMSTMVMGGGGFGTSLAQYGRLGVPLLARIPGLARFFTKAPASTTIQKTAQAAQTAKRTPLEIIEQGAKTTSKKSAVSGMERRMTKEAGTIWRNQIAARAAQLKKLNLSKSDLKQIYNNPNAPLVDRAAARQLLNKMGENLPKIAPDFKGFNNPLQTPVESVGGKILPKDNFSIGGTVGGTGSGSVDSVPAMLAPGEEVIRTSMSNIFRPILKDINNNGGALWRALQSAVKLFTDAVARQIPLFQSLNEDVVNFSKSLESYIQFKNKEMFDKLKEAQEFEDPLGGGSMRPMSLSNLNPKNQYHTDNVQPTPVKLPIVISQNIIQPRTLQKPKNNKPSFIALPPVEQSGPIPEFPLPESEATTGVPQIPPVDSSNPWISITPEFYGIMV